MTEATTPSLTEASTPVDATVTTPVAPDWRQALPEALRGEKGLADFKGVDGLAKAFLDTKKAYHAKMDGYVKVPGEAATSEEQIRWRKALGVPEESSGYTLDLPEDLRPYAPSETLKTFAPIFHKLNIPPASAQAIVQGYAQHAQTMMAGVQQQYEQKIGELRQEWGDPTFNRRLALAKIGLKEHIANGPGGLGPEWLDEFTGILETTKLGSHPAFFKLFAWLGEQFAEDGHVQADLVPGGTSVDDLKKRKNEIQADADFHSERNPVKHRALVEEWNAIFRQLNPEAIR